MVDVAQLVEHRIVAPVVVGSIPIVHPTLNLVFWTSDGNQLKFCTFRSGRPCVGWGLEFFEGVCADPSKPNQNSPYLPAPLKTAELQAISTDKRKSALHFRGR
jgi:hypothetical protein